MRTAPTLAATAITLSVGFAQPAPAGVLYMRMGDKEISKVFPPPPPEKRSAKASPRGIMRRRPKPAGPPIDGTRRAARRPHRRTRAVFIAATRAPYYVAAYAAPYGVFHPPHGLGHLGYGHHAVHHAVHRAHGRSVAHLAGLLHHAVHHR